MGVGGCHQNILDGQLAAGLNDLLGRVKNGAGNHATIGEHNGQARCAVIEHEAAGVELIVNAGSLVVVHVAFDGEAHPG